MKTRFSKMNGNFYPFDIDYKILPPDIVEVELEDFQKIMNRPQGHSFEFIDGVFVINPPEDTPFKTLAENEFKIARSDREIILNRIANMAAFANDADKGALALSRQLLLDVTKADAVLSATTLDELKQAFKDEFRLATASIQHVLNGTFAEVK